MPNCSSIPCFVGIETARAALRFGQTASALPCRGARFFSLVLADGIAFAQVSGTRFVRSRFPKYKRSKPLTFSAAAKFPPENFSLMIRVTFQSAQATLTDAQLADYSSRIVAALEQRLGATLRTS